VTLSRCNCSNRRINCDSNPRFADQQPALSLSERQPTVGLQVVERQAPERAPLCAREQRQLKFLTRECWNGTRNIGLDIAPEQLRTLGAGAKTGHEQVCGRSAPFALVCVLPEALRRNLPRGDRRSQDKQF
jgi:hypothetical protein